MVKPALVRRFLSESEMLKSVKRTSSTRGRPAGFATALAWGVEVFWF